MLATRAQARLCSAGHVGHIAKLLTASPAPIVLAGRPFLGTAHRFPQQTRNFAQFAIVKDRVPKKDLEDVRVTKPVFPGPKYTDRELLEVEVGHREPETLADSLAWRLVRGARRMVDFVTGVTNERPLTRNQYNARILFLESIAAVPGMVAAVHRHLRSLRRGARDQGWIKTLLEEATNERMHLLTWMNLAEPGWLMRLIFIGAQGVFFNICFVARWISPTFFHRFVGYIEEEAIHTYSRLEREIRLGQIEGWSDPKFPIPDIAVEYWNIPPERRTMLWLTRYIRADEAGHRGVNHTLANLDQQTDPNPFEPSARDENPKIPNAVLRPQGYERSEVIEGIGEREKDTKYASTK